MPHTALKPSLTSSDRVNPTFSPSKTRAHLRLTHELQSIVKGDVSPCDPEQALNEVSGREARNADF